VDVLALCNATRVIGIVLVGNVADATTNKYKMDIVVSERSDKKKMKVMFF